MKKRIKFFISWRYLFPRKKRLSQSSHKVAIAGISMGVMALIGTLGVMNGLQQGYISAILEVGSYHARIHSRGYLLQEVINQILTLPDVITVEPLLESHVLLETSKGRFNAFFLRAMSAQCYARDLQLRKKLHIKNEKFPQNGQILVGKKLFDSLFYPQGQNSLGIVALPQGQLKPFIQPLEICDTFRTGYYEYDRNMAFITLEDGLKYVASEKEIFYGVKLKNLNHTQKFIKKMHHWGLDASSWHSYNRAFLGALKLEKNMMIFLLSLIFVIVAVNIFQGRQREIKERYEEIAILRALGANEGAIRFIFAIQGFIIGLLGSGIGLVCGVVLTTHINQIFTAVEGLVNAVLSVLTRLGWGFYTPVSFFSTYYTRGLPVLMYTHENLFFAFLALASATLSALWASRYVCKIKPLEILKNQ